VAQLGEGPEPVRSGVELGWLVQFPAAPSQRFGPVHRDVGAADKIVHGLAVVPGNGDADARGRDDLQPFDQHRGPEDVQEPGGTCRCFIRPGKNVHNDELVAGQPGNGGLLPGGRDQAPRHGNQQLVPRRVSQAVIDRLEVVKVDAQGRQRALPGAPGCQESVQLCLQARPVGKAGQGVLQGESLQFSFRFGAAGFGFLRLPQR
jgi:hypothetical protein